MTVSLSATLRDKRRQQAVDEIAGVAHKLFHERGFDATSVDEIAAAAGCSPRTFYRYFGSKEDVLFYDLPDLLDQWTEILDLHLASGLGPWAAVTESAVELTDRFDAANERIATERMTLWLKEPQLRARYMQYIASAEDAITKSLLRGATKETDTDLAPFRAVAAVGAYRMTLLLHHDKGVGPELAKYLREALAAMGAGLAER